METKLINNLKKYMYELAKAKYNDIYSPDFFKRKIDAYQTACNVMLDQCNALGINVDDLVASYCGYTVSVSDLYSFENQCDFYL